MTAIFGVIYYCIFACVYFNAQTFMIYLQDTSVVMGFREEASSVVEANINKDSVYDGNGIVVEFEDAFGLLTVFVFCPVMFFTFSRLF